MNVYEDAVAKCYSTWGRTYYDEYYGESAPYPPAHRDLLRALLKKNKVRKVLDAGCGPASFLRDITDLNLELYGFDLTPEMVAEGKKIFTEKGLSSDRIWLGSVLNQNSFVDPCDGLMDYDAVICGGVLPHIPANQDRAVVSNIVAALKPGGICAIEARNQLFALFTMNRYSYDLFVNELICPDKLKQSSAASPQNIDAVLDEMRQQFCMDIPPIRKGKKDEPGYDEVLSRTHNPLVLKKILEEMGLVDVKLMFYHYHALPPMYKHKMPELFLERSLSMEKDPEDWRGYFMASAFYVVGYKAE